MVIKAKWLPICLGLAVVVAFQAAGQEQTRAAKREATPESLKAEIEALKSPRVAWRKIVWKSCLLDGLKEARAKGKPALLWVFIDRPVDDARC